jgi:hypothetical protein
VAEEPDADLHLGENLLGTMFRPRRTLEALTRQPKARPGASAIALLGIFWTALSILLWNAGRAPRFALLPIPPDLYYLVQGLLVLPIVTALWWLFSEIAHRLCRAAGGEGHEAGVRAALGFAYAVPMLAHVLVELCVYLALGFEGLAVVARFSMPIAALWVWALSALTLRIAHRVSTPVAVGAAFAGLLVQAAAGALVLR